LLARKAYRRDIVEVEMAFLDGLAMVALWIREAKQALLEEVAVSR
jgi:hypothetical protein